MAIPDDWGLPVIEALEALSDPELLADCRRKGEQARRRRRSVGIVRMPDGRTARIRPTGPDERAVRLAQRSADAAWHVLRTSFEAKLLSGELIATGVAVPLTLEGGRKVIPSEKWSLLRPDYRSSSAKGHGLELISVRIGRRADATFPISSSGDSETPEAAARPSPAEIVPDRNARSVDLKSEAPGGGAMKVPRPEDFVARARGRPPKIHRARQLLHEHAESGVLRPSMVSELEYINACIEAEHGKSETLSIAYMKKKLGEEYRELRDKKGGEKKRATN